MNFSQVRTYLGTTVAALPAIAGALYAGFKLFVTHGLPAPEGGSAIVLVTGLDCLRGVHTFASCPALFTGIISLFLSVAIGYFVYERAAGYLVLVALLFGITGVVTFSFDDNLAQVLLVSALLLAAGALVMEPEVVTERVRDGFDGRFAGR